MNTTKTDMIADLERGMGSEGSNAQAEMLFELLEEAELIEFNGSFYEEKFTSEDFMAFWEKATELLEKEQESLEQIDAFLREFTLEDFIAASDNGSWQKFLIFSDGELSITAWTSPNAYFKSDVKVLYSFPTGQQIANSDLSAYSSEDDPEDGRAALEVERYLEYCYDQLAYDIN